MLVPRGPNRGRLGQAHWRTYGIIHRHGCGICSVVRWPEASLVGAVRPWLYNRWPNFAYRAADMQRHWHLAVFRDESTVFGVGVVRRGRRVTDLEFKLHVTAFRSIAPNQYVTVVKQNLRRYSGAIQESGLLTETRSHHLVDVILKYDPS